MSETNAGNDKPMITENITHLLLDLDGCLSGGKIFGYAQPSPNAIPKKSPRISASYSPLSLKNMP